MFNNLGSQANKRFFLKITFFKARRFRNYQMLRPFAQPVACGWEFCCCGKFETGQTFSYVQTSLSIKVRGAHPGAEGGTWGTKRLGFVSVVAFFLPSKSQYAWVRQCEISFLLTSTSRGGLTYGRTDGHVTTKFSCMM